MPRFSYQFPIRDEDGRVIDDACNVVLMITGEEQRNKARFLLTPEESEKLDAVSREIEARIGGLLAADYVAPEPVTRTNRIPEQSAADSSSKT